ncbi:MAG: isoprenylcysteine carboxylmethyltransferase family protein [Candidatus Marinimicrobia bacterium]|jgi:protein-S-isoprenylcysteine O-methyltransferase Ste14|nr:protein-S-isoprenylcysteine methyltransferase [Candidatus Neomarinimicrobiota bacterium]MDP6457347.1 isoprenylcysteine carboxylmethyltransferase family protein [Candidatus Neomarinimicrobiota bacterium]MDP6593785.1 isoprenylcysteine carboxylmethyltransferase family protein [Candidatus Neomarinimicrobiota bacterium]MDP6836440.1 isoprenylcysteine carboxylmethyltransferase family protein [Candidatus Neomarinimicrobiota bacterium]MDP6967350.1 isoprenylcysteine carboxylmethyltransferase family pr|tara:strand:+ start:5734 stop:6312 length:579 start_codon:yes stop_codon:yes gene_type:complete
MDLRQFLFRNRSYTPIPLALAILFFARHDERLFLTGLAVIVLGEMIRMSGVRYAGGATRTRKVGAKVLCTAGPFAHQRNPLYLGNIIIYAGVAVASGAENMGLLLLVTVVFFSLQYGFIINIEEETLRGLFGRQYEDYAKAVPRLFPRVTPWAGRTKTTPLTWKQTVRTERRTLQTLAVFLVFLVARIYLMN